MKFNAKLINVPVTDAIIVIAMAKHLIIKVALSSPENAAFRCRCFEPLTDTVT